MLTVPFVWNGIEFIHYYGAMEFPAGTLIVIADSRVVFEGVAGPLVYRLVEDWRNPRVEPLADAVDDYASFSSTAIVTQPGHATTMYVPPGRTTIYLYHVDNSLRGEGVEKLLWIDELFIFGSVEELPIEEPEPPPAPTEEQEPPASEPEPEWHPPGVVLLEAYIERGDSFPVLYVQEESGEVTRWHRLP